MNNLLLIKKSFENDILPKSWLAASEKYKLVNSRYKNLCIISSYVNLIQKEFLIFSEAELIFYSKLKGDFLNSSDLNLFYNKSKDFTDDLIKGDLFSVTDTSYCLYDSKKDKLYLFSSCCGSGTIYYTKSNKDLFFATHTNFLKNIRKYNISKLGLSEIIRFGANYTKNTIFKELKKIPFADVLVIESNKHYFINSYYSKIKYLYTKKDDFKSLFNTAISSYKLKKASILFSSGIDSTVISESSNSIKNLQLFHMRNNLENIQDELFLDYMKTRGSNISKIIYKKNFNKILKTISSYSLPSIDFSILPTEQLIEESSMFSRNIIEGTGGDAWFGFSEIKNLKIWDLLSPFYNFSNIASSILMRLFDKGININFINYLLYIFSRLSYSKRAEISQLASNPYSFSQMNTTKKEWKIVEKKISNQIDNLTDFKSSKFEKYRITDACLVAISQFAAKTGQSSLRSNLKIFYPFFHPLIVSYAMQLKKDQIFSKDLGYKVILKKLLIKNKFPKFYIHRKKIGFQPPLKDIFTDKDNIDLIHQLLIQKNQKLDVYFSKLFLNSLKDKNCIERCKSIKELYMIWSYFSIKVWINNFKLE